MASTQPEAMNDLCRGWTEAPMRYPDRSLEVQRHDLEHWGNLTAERPGVEYPETDADGVPAMMRRSGRATGARSSCPGTGSRRPHTGGESSFSKFGRDASGSGRRRSHPVRSSVTTEDDRPCRTW
jgi:hypothetical protein